MGKLSKTLQHDLEHGVPCILDLSGVKVTPGLKVYTTGRVKRKQRPIATKKYPGFAKPINRDDRICCLLEPKNFDSDTDGVEKHIKDTVGNVLTERTVTGYLVEHRVKKATDKADSDKDIGIANHYDVQGIFVVRNFTPIAYGSDSEDSE